MTGAPLDPYACAAVIVAAFSLAGIVHVLWMRSAVSRALAIPLDGGAFWRGRRIFGDHKTVRGFVALPPALGLAFAAFGSAREALPAWLEAGLWDLSPGMLFVVGAWAGVWFMAGELPNSFLKRRWAIAPGSVPASGAKRVLCLVLDRLDSIVAMLFGLALIVPVPWLTAIAIVVLGPAVHLLFSALLCLVHVKARLA